MSKFANLVREPDEHLAGSDGRQRMHLREAFAQPRTLRTRLTDVQLEKCGLQVIDQSAPYSSRLYGNIHYIEHMTLPPSIAGQWLMEKPVNDVEQIAGNGLSWLQALRDRQDQLRSIAIAESLPFSEESSAAALEFVHSLSRARMPSTFLIANGNIRLLWVTDDQEQLGLQFRPSGEIQYVFFKARNDRLVHMMGTETSEGILETITAMGLTHVMHE